MSHLLDDLANLSFKIQPNDDLKCPICHEVACNPWQHVDCGKLFCGKCITQNGLDKPCPACRKNNPRYFKDNKSKREIGELCVKCNNMERGCQWEGTVGTLKEHLGVCDFTQVPCSNKCKDDNGILMIMRRDLQQHLKTCPNRNYSCEHCGLKGTYATTQDHYHTCKKMIVTCTNEECDMRMERKKIKNHLANDCEHTVISCKYVSIECDVKLKRKDMRAHEQDDKAHLNKALNTVVKLEDTVVKLNDEVIRTKINVDKLEGYTRSLKKGESMTFELTGYQRKKDNNEIFTSPPFYTRPNGYHMNVIVYANGEGAGRGSHISVFVQILQGMYDEKLNWPFAGTVNIELLNQLDDVKHYSQKIPLLNMIIGNTSGLQKFIRHASYPVPNPRYVRDNTLYFRVSFESLPHHPQWLECTARNECL